MQKITSIDLRNSITSLQNSLWFKVIDWCQTNSFKLSLSVLTIISVVTWYSSYTSGLSLAYSDSMSHLNLSRLVIDNLQPGLAQMGGVWLPVNRIASLPFVWLDPLWRSGLAGSLISMFAYVGSTLTLYYIIYRITNLRIAALIGSLTFALNPNALYLQTTSLTEMTYIGAFILSTYAFVRWITTERSWYLTLTGLGGFVQVLTRYDGWFVTIMIGMTVGIYALWFQKSTIRQAIGQMLAYGTPVMFGIALWLLWGLLIYGQPLYFAFGPHSARAQQTVIAEHSGLITKGNLGLSALTYYYTLSNNVGYYLLIPALAGGLLYLYRGTSIQRKRMLLLIIVLLSPILFNIIALYLGFSIINIPELNWRPSGITSEQWFNVRYGIFALPLIATGVGLLAAQSKRYLFLSVLLVIFQYLYICRLGIITITDGVSGSSAFPYNDLAQQLRQNVQPNERVLLSTSYFNPVAFRSGQQLRQFVHEGARDYWQPALTEPQKYVQWIVMANGRTGEPAYESMIASDNPNFNQYFTLAYQGKHANLYRRKTTAEMFVTTDQTQLRLGDEAYFIQGVNSYDLIFQTEENIDKNLQLLSQQGINTLRFWLFGEGQTDYLQPKAGEFNEKLLQKVDYLLQQADQYQIRVIPTLANNWTDYGGKNQYLIWAGYNPKQNETLFYTDPNVKQLYRNMLNHLLSRTNTLTQQAYNQDPTILAWDLINEPRLNSPNTVAVATWTQEMASYAQTLAPNQLITIGTEQLTTNSSDLTRPTNLCAIAAIDLCSVHLYWYQNQKPWFSSPDQTIAFLQQQYDLAKAQAKPIILQEYGIAKNTTPFGQPPLQTLRTTHQAATKIGYQGSLLWNWSLQPDSSFGFAPTDPEYSLDAITKIYEN